MDIQLYWQAIVIYILSWVLALGVLDLLRKVYFPKATIRWGIIFTWFSVLAVAGLVTGQFAQKTHLPEQRKLVSSMKSIMQDDERVLDTYLNHQPNRELSKTQTEHAEELRAQQEKTRKLIEGTRNEKEL